MHMHHYEIDFYGKNHEHHWCYFLTSDIHMSDEDIVSTLKHSEDIEQVHIDNIVCIRAISETEFVDKCGETDAYVTNHTYVDNKDVKAGK